MIDNNNKPQLLANRPVRVKSTSSTAARTTYTGCPHVEVLTPNPDAAPQMADESTLCTPRELSALSTVLPARFRFATWRLAYATHRDGTSLRTLYRRMPSAGATGAILIVRDMAGYIFGAFSPVVPRVAARYYGTGETCVFRLRPDAVVWRWWSDNPSDTRSDFFMLGTLESLAVGSSTEHCALWLDEELSRGSSGYCDTFGSPCLASAEEFSVAGVEVWVV